MTGPTVPNEVVDQALRAYNKAIGAGLGRRAAMSRALAAVRTQTANEIVTAIRGDRFDTPKFLSDYDEGLLDAADIARSFAVPEGERV